MIRVAYGPAFRWFAWYPINTRDRGWRWLRVVHKCRVEFIKDGFTEARWFETSVEPFR